MYKPDERDTTSNYTVAYGCLPVEITFHLASYFEYLKAERGMDLQSFGYSIQQINGLMEVTSVCERILRDPVPVAYNM
jgi:putative membrane protein